MIAGARIGASSWRGAVESHPPLPGPVKGIQGCAEAYARGADAAGKCSGTDGGDAGQVASEAFSPEKPRTARAFCEPRPASTASRVSKVGCLSECADPQLVEDVGHVELRGVLADAQFLGGPGCVGRA